jgi:hypothetical protein
MKKIVSAVVCAVIAGPSAFAGDDAYLMTPTVPGVYACEGPDIGSNPAKFGLLPDAAFRLEDKEGDLMMYDGVFGMLQLGMMGEPAMKLKRTGPEEYTYMAEGENVSQTVCKLVPGKDPAKTPW